MRVQTADMKTIKAPLPEPPSTQHKVKSDIENENWNEKKTGNINELKLWLRKWNVFS